ncbi:MAG: orotidine-5'-phosphate decarboxylase [Thermoanaerobaculia bacterium]|nr:orotidine-5'-phosphate decarboxylase [Thermoanaerobaculia bacterium]
MNRPLDRVAVALDTDDWSQFQEWCDRFGPRVGVLKVGLQAFVRFGPEAVKKAAATGADVFLDLKLHDIPNTVAGAVAAARTLGVAWITVHTEGGRRMLEAATVVAGGAMGVLGVTVLTHLQEHDLEDLGCREDIEERVLGRARLARASGCAGVVCSPRELARLRSSFPEPFLLATPGIRPRGASRDDQRRVATPTEARDAGADLLVIGRPLTRSSDSEATLRTLERDLRI